MSTQRIYADFNNLDDHNRLRLTCAGTVADLDRYGIKLREGLTLTFYMDDADEEGEPDELLVEGVVQHDAEQKTWVAAVDWSAVRHASDEKGSSPPNLNPPNGVEGIGARISEAKKLFVVLPYLRIRKHFQNVSSDHPLLPERVRLRGIEFRRNLDYEGLPSGAEEHLKTITSLFRFWRGDPINEMVCAVIPRDKREGADTEKTSRRLREALLLIAYLYTTPHHAGGPVFPYEYSTPFFFDPEPVPLALALRTSREGTDEPSEDKHKHLEVVPGYRVTKDWNVNFLVTPESRILPHMPILAHNEFQDLCMDVETFAQRPQNWALCELMVNDASVEEETCKRVFLAIQWYVRSCRESLTDDESILNLSNAFYSHLCLENGPGLTDRFRDAILTLLGPVDRLDSWISQFYDARSKIVHEGKPRTLYFFAGEKKASGGKEERMPHGQLRDYGFRIFRLCLNAIASGATMAHSVRLSASFVHNKERLERLCKTLKDTTVNPQDRLNLARGDIEDLSGLPRDPFGFESDVKLETVLSVTKKLLAAYKDTLPTVSSEAEVALKDAIEKPAAGESQRIEQLKQLLQLLAQETMTGDRIAFSNRILVCTFLEYATQPAFSLRVLQQSRKK